DVLLYEDPGSPSDYGAAGFNPKTTRLEMWTEFFSPPKPQKVAVAKPDNLDDEDLSFGQMAIGPGKAFLLNASEDSVPIAKSWQEISGRQFLIESVLLSEAEPFLGTLQAGLSQEKKERQYASAT